MIFDNDGVSTPVSTGGLNVLDSGTYESAAWEVDSYVVNDGGGSQTVYAFICHPTGEGAYPLQIYNHPGYEGLFGTLTGTGGPGSDDLGNCINAALNGWATAMSSYRGEPVNGQFAQTADAAEIEVCLGEVTDVLRLTEMVLVKSYVDSSKVLMWGYSHGGCITDRAVETGVPVQAAATFAAMTDLGAMNDECNAYGCDLPYYPIPNADGYTPSSEPIAYNWRSPANFAADLNARAGLPFLMLQGVDLFPLPGGSIYADGALQTGAACELASLMTPQPTNVYLTEEGEDKGTPRSLLNFA